MHTWRRTARPAKSVHKPISLNLEYRLLHPRSGRDSEMYKRHTCGRQVEADIQKFVVGQICLVVEPSDPSYRGHLGEGTEGPRGEVRGGSSLEGAGKGRLWRKGSCKGVDRGARRVNALLSYLSCLYQRALPILFCLYRVNILVNLIAIN